MNRIEEIINEIRKLQEELLSEIQKKEEEFFYKIQGKKVLFEDEARKYQKKFIVRISTYLFNASFLHILTVPVIWFCIIPALFMDLSVTVFQYICFRVYNIPRVDRGKYIIIDRHSLSYLNMIEKNKLHVLRIFQRIDCVHPGNRRQDRAILVSDQACQETDHHA